MNDITEENLIEEVRTNPILYDMKHRQYRNLPLRKETWDKIGEKMGVSGERCKETWNKLRNAYTNALNRRKSKTGQSSKKMAKWVFEDQMAFLPLINTRRQSRRNSIRIEEEEDESEDQHDRDFRYIIPVEITSTADDNTHPSPLQTANEAFPTDQSNNPAINFQTYNNSQESINFNSKIEATMNELVTVVKSNRRMLSRHIKHQSQSLSQPNCTHDEDEMYLLSLARFVKKLNPAERIRVKSEVSQIIFQAEIRNLNSDAVNNNNNNHQQIQLQSTLSQHSSIASEQFLSETSITNLKTEKQ